MSVPAVTTEYWVGELAKLVTEHVAKTREAITRLEDRIIDLEGHAEHGPDGTCGVCAPEPETVSADTYSVDRIFSDDTDVRWASAEMECSHPTCFDHIMPGHAIVSAGPGHSGHNEWRHRDH